HSQSLIHDIEKLTRENRNFEYYLPVIRNNQSVANIVVSVDYQKYFDEVFSVFNMKEYQWQWVVSDSGQIIYDNTESGIRQIQLDRIITDLENTTTGNLVHKAEIDGKDKDIISSFYSTRLLQRDLGLVFSAPTDFFQKYIIRNSFLIVLATLLILLAIITLFLRYIKSQRVEVQKLSESERMLYKLIEEMPVSVIIHNKKREILKANKIAASLFSYSGEEEMKGETFPEQPVTTAGRYFAKNLGGEFNPEKFVIITQEGGGEQILYKNSIPVIFAGEEANLEILIDVTMLESARQQEAKANEAKSEFLARMSYEIRTPLNGIIGITDIINRYEVSDEVKNVVSLLRRSTEILLNIINDILDFSRIEAGEMVLDEIPFNLREELGYCADLTRTFISDRDIVFSYQVENDVPESVVGDPVRLRQILINLILHSVINTEKGEIRLKCGLKENNSGVLKLEFELRDTGNSFGKASLEKIFGEMRDIGSRISAGKDESVLGTILARHFIEMMGGELSAESPSGLSGDKGTRVVFTLATYSNDRIIKNLDLKKIDSFEKIRTLVITGQQYRDEEIMTLFHKLGLNVSVTTFQRHTVEQLKANVKYPDEKYDMVVIIDDKDFDGFEAADSIRQNNLSENFIVQLISSNDRKGNFLKSVKMGVDHYLVKPFDTDEFVRALLVSFPYIESHNYSNDL
ncbi:MAG: hypothetical protein JXN62_07430, partial [Bacteroidales bacterium]|nr:hypothetical protein [Bacteroidales bacterium]